MSHAGAVDFGPVVQTADYRTASCLFGDVRRLHPSPTPDDQKPAAAAHTLGSRCFLAGSASLFTGQRKTEQVAAAAAAVTATEAR